MSYEGFFEIVLTRLVQACEKKRTILIKIKTVLISLSGSYSKVKLFIVLAQIIASKALKNPVFYSELAGILENMITYEAEFYELRATLANYKSEEGNELFRVLYPAMCFNSPSALVICFYSQKYELAWMLINKM